MSYYEGADKGNDNHCDDEIGRDKLLRCPFCGMIPLFDGYVVTHRSPHNRSCLVDDTQYSYESWMMRDGKMIIKKGC